MNNNDKPAFTESELDDIASALDELFGGDNKKCKDKKVRTSVLQIDNYTYKELLEKIIKLSEENGQLKKENEMLKVEIDKLKKPNNIDFDLKKVMKKNLFKRNK